jgi:pyruvate/2-oxoglutarate dehydrogenase complex dihydrolipoamide dehydrogenase (E3) component
VNEHYQTAVPHIYAAGDVIGFPSLASSSMLQGRLAVCHMWGQQCARVQPSLIPYGIYCTRPLLLPTHHSCLRAFLSNLVFLLLSRSHS